MSVAAQGVRLSGQVVLATGARRQPLAGTWAVLHRLGPAGMGALDSARTGADGGYRLTIEAPDSTVRYMVGVRYADVGYLSGPIDAAPRGDRRIETIVVYDSTSTGEIALSQRHLLIQAANPDGSIPVLELLVIRNAGSRTRIPADTTRATWSVRLLAGATAAEIGESDIDHEVIEHQGDSIAVMGPITPGEKQIVVTYLMPRTRRLVLPRREAVGTLGVMIADTLVAAPAPLAALEISSFENTRYLRMEARDVGAGDPLVFDLSRPPPRAGDFWWLVVGVTAVGLAGGLAAWWRSRARGVLTEEESLALQVAALDAALERGEDEATRARRDSLMRRLESALAEHRGGE